MTAATELSRHPAIDYPESDGLPMADNTLQFRWISTIKWGVEAIFLRVPDVFVAGNLLWYPVEGEPRIRIGPDVLVAFNRPKGERRSYKQWEEGNVAPQVTFEVLSPGNRAGAMGEKLAFYEHYGVEEYYVYDPDDGSLEGWLRAGDRLEEIPQMAGFVSARLGVRFEPGTGPDNLKIFGPDGSPFLTFTEWVERSQAEQRRADAAEALALEQASFARTQRQRAERERQRAEAERLRADDEGRRAEQERQRAETERERADRLAARLRELGADPE